MKRCSSCKSIKKDVNDFIFNSKEYKTCNNCRNKYKNKHTPRNNNNEDNNITDILNNVFTQINTEDTYVISLRDRFFEAQTEINNIYHELIVLAQQE